MSISDYLKNNFLEKISSDESLLKKRFNSFKVDFYKKMVPKGEIPGDEWIINESLSKRNKRKDVYVKKKHHAVQFENDLWCMFYNIGFKELNIDEHLRLPLKDKNDSDQIDVLAIDRKSEIVYIVEAKSRENKGKEDYKYLFQTLDFKIDQYRRSVQEVFGHSYNVKFIFATRKILLSTPDKDRLAQSKAFHFDDNIFNYLETLTNDYKETAIYQFNGLIYGGKRFSKKKDVHLPAIQGKMGNKTYYMFNANPEFLLKAAYILHRRPGISNSYQRVISKARLKAVRTFVDEGGFFPNSIILSLNKNTKHNFLPSKKTPDVTNSSIGELILPETYAMAYVIDGQHRLYGYAGSTKIDKDTLPVVLFTDLLEEEQLKMFMDINEKQVSVKKSLRIDLKRDIDWKSVRIDSRMVALRSEIVFRLNEYPSSVFFNAIDMGNTRAKSKIPNTAFDESLSDSGLIPKATSKEFKKETLSYSLYDGIIQDKETAMDNAADNIYNLIDYIFTYVNNNVLKINNGGNISGKFLYEKRGIYALITSIGRIHTHLVSHGKLNIETSHDDRAEQILDYLKPLFDVLIKINTFKAENDEQIKDVLRVQGAGAKPVWLYYYIGIINNTFPDFNPPDFAKWAEAKEKKLIEGESARDKCEEIEKFLNNTLCNKLKERYKTLGDDWFQSAFPEKTLKDVVKNISETKRRFIDEGKDPRVVTPESVLYIKDLKEIAIKNWDYVQNELAFNHPEFPDFKPGNNSVKKMTGWIQQFSISRNALSHANSADEPNYELIDALYEYFIK